MKDQLIHLPKIPSNSPLGIALRKESPLSTEIYTGIAHDVAFNGESISFWIKPFAPTAKSRFDFLLYTKSKPEWLKDGVSVSVNADSGEITGNVPFDPQVFVFSHQYVNGFGWENTIYCESDFSSISIVWKENEEEYLFRAIDNAGHGPYLLKGTIHREYVGAVARLGLAMKDVWLEFIKRLPFQKYINPVEIIKT